MELTEGWTKLQDKIA